MLYALGNRDSLLHAQFNVMFPLLSLSALLYSLWLFPSLSTSLVFSKSPFEFSIFLQKYTQYIIRTSQSENFKNKKGGSWWRSVFLSCLRNAEWIPRREERWCKEKDRLHEWFHVFHLLNSDKRYSYIKYYILYITNKVTLLKLAVDFSILCALLSMYCSLCLLLNLVFDWHVACQVDLPHWMSIWMSSFANWGSKNSPEK